MTNKRLLRFSISTILVLTVIAALIGLVQRERHLQMELQDKLTALEVVQKVRETEQKAKEANYQYTIRCLRSEAIMHGQVRYLQDKIVEQQQMVEKRRESLRQIGGESDLQLLSIVADSEIGPLGRVGPRPQLTNGGSLPRSVLIDGALHFLQDAELTLESLEAELVTAERRLDQLVKMNNADQN